MTSNTGVADFLMDLTRNELAAFVSTHDVECIWRMKKHLEGLLQWAETDAITRDFILSTLATLLDNDTNRNRIPVWPRTLLYHTRSIALADVHPTANLPEEIGILDTTLELAKNVKTALEEGDEEKLKAQGASGQRKPRPEELDDLIRKDEKFVRISGQDLG